MAKTTPSILAWIHTATDDELKDAFSLIAREQYRRRKLAWTSPRG